MMAKFEVSIFGLMHSRNLVFFEPAVIDRTVKFWVIGIFLEFTDPTHPGYPLSCMGVEFFNLQIVKIKNMGKYKGKIT